MLRALLGDMTKRAALARALAPDPEVLFLDEPASGLDPIRVAGFDALITTLLETPGLTVFMVTHDLASLAGICDRIIAIAGGRISAGSHQRTLDSEQPWVGSSFVTPKLSTVRTFRAPENPRTSDQGSKRPGRVINAIDGAVRLPAAAEVVGGYEVGKMPP